MSSDILDPETLSPDDLERWKEQDRLDELVDWEELGGSYLIDPNEG